MAKRDQKLSASITIGSVLQGSVKKNVGVLKSGLAEIGGAIKKVEQRQKELAKQRQVLEKEGRSVEALDREYDELGRTLDDLRHKQERWSRAASASRRVGAAYSDMVGGLRRNAATLGIGATVAGGAVFGLASSTAQLGDDVAKTADKLGIGITELQELRFAAERSGVATGQFDTALEKMQKNLGEAATGTGTAKDALEQLGLKADDLIRLKPDEALERIAEEMDKVETAAEKAAIANDIFGRSGVGMINMLRGGKDNLDQLREAARRTGFVLSEEAARDAEVFQDTLLDTQLTLKGLKNTVGTALLPVVTGAMSRIGDALVENRAQVQEWAGNFADGVERAIPIIGDLVTGIGTVVTKTSEVISTVAEMVGGWENLGVIVGGVFAAKTVGSVLKFSKAIFGLGRAMGLMMIAGGPAVWAIGAIASGALLVAENWGAIRATLEPVFNWIGDAFKGLGEKISKVIDQMRWVITTGADAIFGDGKSTKNRIDQLAARKNKSLLPPIQQNALGGTFRPGWHLTGERGPELKFESRAGFVANNRALRQMVSMSDRISAGGRAGGAAAPGPVSNVYNINVDAQGMSVDQLMGEIERRTRQAANNGLFDRAPAFGPYGR